MTQAQQKAIRKLPGYRVMAKLQNGAVLVARSGKRTKAKVIDTDGSEFSFRRYLDGLDQRR